MEQEGRSLLDAFHVARDSGAPFPCEDEEGYARWLDAKFALETWAVRDGGVEALIGEIDRLRSLLPHTADGALIADCGTLYCPKCNGPMVFSNVGCFCDQHCYPEGADEEICLSKPKLI